MCRLSLFLSLLNIIEKTFEMSYHTHEWADILLGFSEQQSDHLHNEVLQAVRNSPDHTLQSHINTDE